MLSKWRSRFGLFAVLALTATMLVIVPASAATTGSGPIDTGATIGGGTYVPEILCKWELPDMDRDKNTGMQYIKNNASDDSSASPAESPCSGNLATAFNYDQGVNVIQVEANPEDLPTERMIELWAAVVGPNGTAVTEVIWKIYHPDGSFKWQEHGTRQDDPENGPLGPWATVGAGNTYDLTSNGMWAAALRTGQIASATIAGQTGLIAMENQGELELWRGSFDLSKHQPCGPYRVEAYATSYTGDTTEAVVNYIDVVCFVELETDFTSVDWGQITPGSSKVVAGDVDWTTPQFPTVRNTGSGAMTLSIAFAEMTLDGDQDPNSTKIIDEFDAYFGLNASNLYGSDSIFAGPEGFDFGRGYYQTLCANEMGKLDLSVHPKAVGLIAGHYSGSVTLVASRFAGQGDEINPNPCLNEWGDWQTPQTDPITVRYPPTSPD